MSTIVSSQSGELRFAPPRPREPLEGIRAGCSHHSRCCTCSDFPCRARTVIWKLPLAASSSRRPLGSSSTRWGSLEWMNCSVPIWSTFARGGVVCLARR
jgi:hypothetical protein